MSTFDDFLSDCVNDTVNNGDTAIKLDSSDEIVMVEVARSDLEAVLSDMKQTFSAMPRNIAFSRNRLGRAIQVVEGWLA